MVQMAPLRIKNRVHKDKNHGFGKRMRSESEFLHLVGASRLACSPDRKVQGSIFELTIGRPALADSGLVIPTERSNLAR